MGSEQLRARAGFNRAALRIKALPTDTGREPLAFQTMTTSKIHGFLGVSVYGPAQFWEEES